MLFKVEMKVNWPNDLSPNDGAALKEKERVYSAALQETGVWLHLWRTTGQFGNVSIFDVASNDALHEVLTGLPFFPFMTLTVTPLSSHPSRISNPPLRAT